MGVGCCGNGSAKLKCHLSQASDLPVFVYGSSGFVCVWSGHSDFLRGMDSRARRVRSPDDTWRRSWHWLYSWGQVINSSPTVYEDSNTNPLSPIPGLSPSLFPPKMWPSCDWSANKIINCCSALNSWPRRCCRAIQAANIVIKPRPIHAIFHFISSSPSTSHPSTSHPNCRRSWVPWACEKLLKGRWAVHRGPIINGDNDLIGR